MGVETALIATAIASTAIGGYSVYSGQQAAKEQKKEMKKQRTAAEQREEDLLTQKKLDSEQQAMVKRRRMATVGGDPATRGTITTSPLGVIGSPVTSGKTLLGS